MDFNEYQKQAKATDKYPDSVNKMEDYDKSNYNELLRMLYTLGLVGEAGEVADKMKKIFRDKGGNFSQEDALGVVTELSDCLWYIAMISKEFGYTLEQIAEINIEKLKIRVANNKIHGSGDNR